MLKYLALTVGLLASTCTASAPAYATTEPVCADRGVLIEKLESQYKETIESMGLASNGTMLEVLTSPSGTWTILSTRPDGTSCIVGAGKHWQSAKKLPGQLA